MERKIQLIPYRVYKYCPKCTGTMEACDWGRIQFGPALGISGTILTTNTSCSVATTATFNHKCNKCGHGENYEKSYPYIDYIENGNLEQ